MIPDLREFNHPFWGDIQNYTKLGCQAKTAFDWYFSYKHLICFHLHFFIKWISNSLLANQHNHLSRNFECCCWFAEAHFWFKNLFCFCSFFFSVPWHYSWWIQLFNCPHHHSSFILFFAHSFYFIPPVLYLFVLAHLLPFLFIEILEQSLYSNISRR